MERRAIEWLAGQGLNDAVISAVPVAERALDDAADPLLIRARAEGRAVA